MSLDLIEIQSTERKAISYGDMSCIRFSVRNGWMFTQPGRKTLKGLAASRNHELVNISSAPYKGRYMWSGF